MHQSSFQLMQSFRNEFALPLAGKSVLEVGSKDENGSYRPLFSGAASYLGIDRREGDLVDLVVKDESNWNFDADSFDLVISGQTLEHTEHPWLVMKEMARVLKPGGYLCAIVPWAWIIHPFPIDCWRILPDGMAVILRDAGLKVVRLRSTQEGDTLGIGLKPPKSV